MALTAGDRMKSSVDRSALMNRLSVRSIGVVLTALVSFSSASYAAELDDHLGFLRPLIGTEWVGGYVGEDAPDVEFTLRFEEILDGTAVRYTRHVPAVKFSAEALFYWNPTRGTVCFLNLHTHGFIGEGVVEFVDGKIVLSGNSHRPDSTIEFTTILEIDADGTLRDTFTGKQDGEWVPGHVQEFVAR